MVEALGVRRDVLDQTSLVYSSGGGGPGERRGRERYGCRRNERDRPIDGGRRCAIGRDGDVRWAEDEELPGF